MDTGRTRIVATNLPESRGGGEREAAAGVVWVWGSRGGGKSEKVGWRREGDLLGGKPPAPLRGGGGEVGGTYLPSLPLLRKIDLDCSCRRRPFPPLLRRSGATMQGVRHLLAFHV